MALVGERALVITNPGSRRGLRLVQPVIDAFRRAGVEADVVMTESPGHGGRIALELAEEYDRVFSLGGDGTAMEIVDALAGTNRSVGVLPGGTGNMLARALRIPLDVRSAVPALLGGTRVRIDLGLLSGGRRFMVAAGVGADAAMISGAPAEARRRYGVMAYVASATRALMPPRTFSVRATVDGRVIERENCVAAMIVNVGSVLNGLMHLGPGIRHDDGRLDLCMYCARDVGDAAIVATRLAFRSYRDDHRTAFASGTHITIETDAPSATEADGELIGTTPLVAEVVPLAAPLLIPRRRN